MTDVSALRGFLSSLAQVSRICLAVQGREGPLLSTGVDGLEPPAPESLERFSARVMEHGAFLTGSADGRLALYGVPLWDGDRMIAALIAGAPPDPDGAGAARGSGMEPFLTELAGLVAERWSASREVEEIAEELTQSFEDLHLYSTIGTQIKALRFSTSMLHGLNEELLENMRADLAFAVLPERPEYDVLILPEGLAGRIPEPAGFVSRLLESIPRGEASLAENYFIVNDSEETPAYRALHPERYRFLAVEIEHNEKFYGWLGLVAFNMQEIFRRGELKLMVSMAEQIAMVIANTDLYRELENFVISMVKSLVYAIEAKDIYTRGHSERVSRFSMRMGEEIGLGDEEKKVLQWAAILHDIGKIGIPESILNKPGPLNDGEYQAIKDHPLKGDSILEPLEQLSASLPGILHHHERWDGKGYPNGLKGEQIPLHGRIIAVADTYDAITSDRAYRKGKSPAEALAVLEQVAGSQLDSRFVQVFKSVLKQDPSLV